MPFEFTNPEVKAKYEPVFGTDAAITIHGTYSGKLSNITPKAAEKLMQLKDNQIRLKPAVNAPIVDAPATEKTKKNTEK